MRKKKTYSRPYGINIWYEFITYIFVGRDYKIRFWKHSYRFIWEQKEKVYKICNTYSEWECHVRTVIRECVLETNGKDFIHWLYQLRNRQESYLEGIKTILIPVYLVIISIVDLFIGEGTTQSAEEEKFMQIILRVAKNSTEKQIVFVSCTMLVVMIASFMLYAAKEKIYFYNDFIKIAEDEFKYNS